MKEVYDKSERLIITGIATNKEDGGTGGILYSKELVDYVIKEASKSEIVQKQLSNKDRDVFSNKDFDDDNKKDNGLNFEDMISSEKLSMDISETGEFRVSFRGIIDGKGKNFPQNLDHKIILLQEPTCLDERVNIQETGFSKFKLKNEVSE